MDLKMFPFPEQLSNGKRKIFSSFGLGVGTSLIVATLIFLYCPVNISDLYNPIPLDSSSSSSSPPSSSSSLPFSVTSSTSELQRDKEERVEEKPNHGNLINGSTNANVSQFDDNQTTHKGNVSVGLQNSSFSLSNGGDKKTQAQFGENSTVSSEGRVPVKTHEENFSEGSKNSSFFVSSGGDKNQTLTQYGNSSKKGESSTISSEGGVPEKTHEGFSSLKEKNGTNLSEGGVGEKNQLGISSNNQTNDEKINKDKSTETDKSEGSLSKEKKEFEIQRGNFDDNGGIPNSNDESRSSSVDLPGLSDKCNIFDGKWVRDEGKPYYPSGSCPHIDRDFNCHLNGRPDDDFLKWKWQPNQCNIPSFNATDFLERLRNKRLIFVGDSLNRNMWESLVCMLRHGVKNKSKVYEITGKREFKVHGFYAFRYEDYNCSVDFVSAPFLVKENIVNGKSGSSETLRLDKMDATTSAYRTADVIVFNTGHWWTHEKTSKGENYYQEGTHVYPKLEVMDAYKKALTTWARWVDKKIDPNRTRVLFRGYSVTHFKGGQWNSGGQCHKETEPIFNETYLAKYPPKMKVLEEVLQQMKTPVLYLNISKLTDYRKDGHPSIYRMKYETEKERVAAVGSQDCSHWCLPGVPDMWNELLYASLLQSGKGSWKY